MFSPRIQQLSVAKCQTIYAPVPAKENNNQSKSVEFARTHRIISSVTVDHIRDIRVFDRTTLSNDPTKKSNEKRSFGKSPLLLRKAHTASVSFFIAGDEAARSRESTANSGNKHTSESPSAGLMRAEVRFTPSARAKNRMMTGGFVMMRDSKTSTDLTSARSITPGIPLSGTISAPPAPTTPGRCSPAANVASPGPFYSPVRGTIRLSSHNRQIYTPNRIRLNQMALTPGAAEANEHLFQGLPIEPRESTPVMESPRTERAGANDFSLVVTGVVGGEMGSIGVLPNGSNNASSEAAENNNKPHPPTLQDETEESQLEPRQPPPAPLPPRLKLPNAHRLGQNARVVVHDAFLPRDNSGSWFFRQKWLRLFARNGANGLAYAYSSKLQNSYS